LIVLLLTTARPADAQGLRHVLTQVALDPFTYSTSAFGYVSARADWKTSQPLFAAGWMEHDPLLTRIGQPDDVPVGYRRGMRTMQINAIWNLATPAAHNAAARLVEGWLTRRFPDHRRLIVVASWAERGATAAVMSYQVAAPAFRQAASNRRAAGGR